MKKILFIDLSFLYSKSIGLLIVSIVTNLLSLAAYATPTIMTWETSHGAKVYFVKTDELPIVDISLIFAAGSAYDGNLPGTAHMVNLLMSNGAGNLSANAIAERFEQVGAVFSQDNEHDMAFLSLRSLADNEHLTPALETLETILTQPHFATEDFLRERNRLQIERQALLQDPQSVAEEQFYRALYPQHPYATPIRGTQQSLEQLTPEQLKTFYQRYYVARNVIVTLVGKIEMPQAKAMVEKLLATLPEGTPAPELPEVTPPESKQLTFPFSSEQAHIYLGFPIVSRKDPDYFTLYVGNHILGGGAMVSRLGKTIREERGLAYGVYSYFVPFKKPGPFQMVLQTKKENADQARSLLLSELSRFISQGPTAEELISAKKHITGGFPLKTNSNNKINLYLRVIGFYQLPLDYLDRFNERIEAVSLEAIKEAFTRRVKPEQLVTVQVGQ